MISAIVLAAGQSTRMGKPKMTLPWGKTTVIGEVISTLLKAGISDICVIGGSNLNDLEGSLRQFNMKLVFNPDFANGEMVKSVQVGLRCVHQESEAGLIVLGDQPQIEAQVIKAIIEAYKSNKHKLIVPSYQLHRGHPWLIDNSLWKEILNLHSNQTLRDFLNRNQDQIYYLCVDTPSVIQDLDTPEDYQKFQP